MAAAGARWPWVVNDNQTEASDREGATIGIGPMRRSARVNVQADDTSEDRRPGAPARWPRAVNGQGKAGGRLVPRC